LQTATFTQTNHSQVIVIGALTKNFWNQYCEQGRNIFTAGENHHVVQKHKINMLQSTGLTSSIPALAGPTYTFHQTNVNIVLPIGHSGCYYVCFQEATTDQSHMATNCNNFGSFERKKATLDH
jgi:hypothetical protein